MKIYPSMYLLAKYQHNVQATTELTMLSGASNRRGSPSVKTSVLHSDTSSSPALVVYQLLEGRH